MIPKPKRKDLIMHYVLSNPISGREILFSNLRNLTEFERNKFSCVRKYQYPMAAFDTLFLYDKSKDEKKNFELKRGMAESYNLGGRLTGKSHIGIKTDVPLAVIRKTFIKGVIDSFDKLHLKGVIDDLIDIFNLHPILSSFKISITQTPDYDFNFIGGINLKSVNNKPEGKDKGCVDDQTEILTDNGWKYFKDLTYKDRVLTKFFNNFAVYSPIKKIISYDYKGYLKRLKNRNSEFLFTPNHNLLVLENKIEKFRPINNNLYSQIFIPSTFIWKGQKPKNITLKGMVGWKYQKQQYDVILWCRFLAWYLSEGSIYISKDKSSHYRIDIPQKKHYKILEKLLANIGFHYTKFWSAGCYHYKISNKLLYKHLLKYFGKKKEKRIPKYFKNYDSKLLKIFIDEYLLGDGCIYKKGKYIHKSLICSLKPLINDLQEVAQKAGYKTNLRETYNPNRFGNPLMYVLTLCLSSNTVFKKKLITDVYYKGKVYCVDVPPNHTILIRRNGHVIWTGNSQWLQKHIDRDWAEEASELTEEVTKKKFMAKSELGMIQRLSGMTEFNDLSPMGKIFNDLSNKNKIINFPSYANPTYSEEDDKAAIQEFNGRDSASYQTQILGRIIPNVANPIDIEKVRECYNENLILKQFEINKDNFFRYKDILILDKPNNAEKAGIYMDIGEGAAPTEIIIIFKLKKFRYSYNITANKITPDELYELVRYIIELIKPNVVSYDNTSGVGVALGSNLKLDFAPNLIPVNFNAKIEVDYEKDKDGNYKTDNSGNYIYEYTRVDDWSFQQFKRIFYNQLIEMPYDYKFDKQVQNLILIRQGGGIKYQCKVANHLWQAFQVFCIAEWKTEFTNIKPIDPPKPSLGYFGGI